jgi:hypothetical protein
MLFAYNYIPPLGIYQYICYHARPILDPPELDVDSLGESELGVVGFLLGAPHHGEYCYRERAATTHSATLLPLSWDSKRFHGGSRGDTPLPRAFGASPH